ncbi:MAG: FAD-dependent oxidoreductase [Caulobacterales bacterium]|nr:FAD-dependent oxidoreductase [Caulobacterales bacterium]
MPWTRRAAVGAVAASGLSVALPPASAAAASNRPPAAPRIHDVAVIGAGVFGAWTAWSLKRAGLDVALAEQHAPGHARASSGGESRVIRVSYGADPLYSPMAETSLAAWDQLSARAGLPILHRLGVLWFSPASDAYMRQSLGWLEQRGLAHRRFDRDGLAAAWPQMVFHPGESGFLEETSGALIAGRGVQTVVRDAGLTPVTLAVAPGPPRRVGEAYELAPGLAARTVVYACGPWLPKLFPDVLAGRIVPTRQEVYHFGLAPGDARFSPPNLPVWADFNAGDLVYGFPDLEGQGFKMAFDAHGPVIDPDTQGRQPTPAGVERARAYLASRFPALADAPLIHARVCQYENSSNGDFLIDRLPGHDRVWLVGAGSGHGFKHGPAIGERVTAHILDPGLAIEPRFSLATKAAEQKREIY